MDQYPAMPPGVPWYINDLEKSYFLIARGQSDDLGSIYSGRAVKMKLVVIFEIKRQVSCPGCSISLMDGIPCMV
jgi:hypothetical protein